MTCGIVPGRKEGLSICVGQREDSGSRACGIGSFTGSVGTIVTTNALNSWLGKIPDGFSHPDDCRLTDRAKTVVSLWPDHTLTQIASKLKISCGAVSHDLNKARKAGIIDKKKPGRVPRARCATKSDQLRR